MIKRVSTLYNHCVSLKKLLSEDKQALMQPLEDSLRRHDKLRPPYGECHHCHDRGHWIGDCPEAQKLREQQVSTDKKTSYGQCYICGLEDHSVPNCHKRKEHLMNDEESQRSWWIIQIKKISNIQSVYSLCRLV